MFSALGGGDMVPDLGLSDAPKEGPAKQMHKSLRVGDLVYFAALAEDKVGEGYLHGEVRALSARWWAACVYDGTRR